ncbi:type II toxin-antitoxin system RelE/ParE family toxin [Alcaligenes aquatilis]|uniref:Type II toxin-antitoxin system RelE/ParE family toxin n=2 Tax=Alcaligenes aquatilis TaxID=323284 RepID=A0ABY4NL57_9BURK|nr:type II toxin-antitoxin system RelE/ParE family toxin [Alcaligenes aquatilis]UQN37676.1 type II toxin-antitoxin system RelE/ParE family toxin [Alcaligenes aquatilis]
MNTVGKEVREVRIKDTTEVFRIFCIAKLVDAVYVLHCFQKKTHRASKTDLDLAAKRYRNLLKEIHQ